MVKTTLKKVCKVVWWKKDSKQVTEPAYTTSIFCVVSENYMFCKTRQQKQKGVTDDLLLLLFLIYTANIWLALLETNKQKPPYTNTNI